MDDVLFSTPSVLETQHMFEQLNNAWKTGLIIAPEKIKTSTPYHYWRFVINIQHITPQLKQICTDKLSTLNDFQKILVDINWIRPSFSSVQSLSRVQLFVTPWIAACQASLSITNSRSSPKPTSIKSVMPSSHLILCHPLFLLPPIPPNIREFSDESTLHMRCPRYWSFSFSIIPSKEYLGLISFRMDWLDLLAVQGTRKSLLQHHSSKALILRRSAFFIVQLTSIHDHWKNHSLD